MIVVAGKAEVGEVWVDPGNGRKVAGRRIAQKARLGRMLEPTKMVEHAKAKIRVDQAKRADIEGVPMPGNASTFEVPNKGRQVVQGHGFIVLAAIRTTGER